MVPNVKDHAKSRKTLVAATSEKAKTYIFARIYIWDREVGGSNPLAPTKLYRNLIAVSIGKVLC